MGVTLNGIAQGYITDRILDILHANGCDQAFGNMGCGGTLPWAVTPTGAPGASISPIRVNRKRSLLVWTCATGRYAHPAATARSLTLRAVPSSVRSVHWGKRASLHRGFRLRRQRVFADALSTALYVTPPEGGGPLLASFSGVSALATLPDGAVQHLGSPQLNMINAHLSVIDERVSSARVVNGNRGA